jgi:serine/threonine protein kinase
MPDYQKEARRAQREGDFSKAGDFYYLAGEEKKAMEMYVKGNHLALAARLLERKEDWRGAAKFYVQAGKFLDAAQIYCEQLKDFRSASAMFEKQNDLGRASEMSEKAGDIARAALLAEQAEQWERAGALYVQAQKYERAADVYSRLLKQLLVERDEKGFLESHYVRLVKHGNNAGALYFRLKSYQKAAQCFEAVENYAKAAECYIQLEQPENAAQAFYKIQNYQQAYDLLARLGDECKNNELFGDVCYHLKQYEEAAELYLKADRPHKAAEAYEEGKYYHRAAELYQSWEDLTKAGELYLMVNDIETAAKLYEKAKNYEYAAKLYEQTGAIHKAIDCLIATKRVLAAAELLIKQDESQKAVSILQEIAPDDDEFKDACILLAHLFTRMEMYPVALQKYAEALRDQPLSKENVDLYYGMALAYEKSGTLAKAREIYEKILSIQFRYKDVLARLNGIKTSGAVDHVVLETLSSAEKRVIGGRYELTEKLSADSSGLLFRGRDTSLGRPVLIRRFPAQEEFVLANIMEQVKAASNLNHSNILAIYDSGKDEDSYFICTESVDGHTLRQHLARGPMNVSQVCELSTQICLALAYAHKKKILHKNLTPEKIYVAAGGQIKITDFGMDGSSGSDSGESLFSQHYSSPEQILAHEIDYRSDLYSFGVILYEMLYGMVPFSGHDAELQHVKKPLIFPENSQRWSPNFLNKIIQRCLQKDRQQRYKNAEEIIEELEVADIVPGMILDERYEILKEVGRGGMGRVYQAKDLDLDEVVALKVLRAEISADPVIQKRFVREIKVARMITHPNVVKVFDIGKYKGNRYISMEFIQGISLDDWMKANPQSDMRILLTILAKVIQGVQAAHSQGIIHRDLKPQNVLLDRSMNPHVLDFGIARSRVYMDTTYSGQIVGSPKYMSPEQIQGKDVDKRSDIYSLGVIMFFMFAGCVPFTGDDSRSIVMKHLTEPVPSMRNINPSVPEWLENIVSKTLEKDPNQRYNSLKEVLNELKKGYDSQKVT